MKALAGALLCAVAPLCAAVEFFQCPAAGIETGCQTLITINPDDGITLAVDSTQPPLQFTSADMNKDVLVGVQNNSSQVLTSIRLAGPNSFAFGNIQPPDGVCGVILHLPAGCPFGPTRYEGPNTSFTVIDNNNGVVNFLGGGIPPGRSAWFSLENPPQSASSPSFGTGLVLQFITKGSDDSLIPQAFTYNSAPCPIIEAHVDNFSIHGNSSVHLSLSGKVTDQASDLVYAPNSQLTTMDVSVGAALFRTVPLFNTASRQPPWRPYAYEAPFSVDLSFDALGPGDFPVQLTTPPNVAGCPGELDLTLNKDHHGPHGAIIAPDWDPGPGTFYPTMLRFRAPAGTVTARTTKIVTFDRSWDIQQFDLGDGEYWYAVDPLQNPVVFLPAADAHSFIQTKKVDLEFEAQVVDGQQVLAKDKITVEQGLLTDNDDVQGLLGNITNFTKKQYVVRKNKNAADMKDVFVYRAATGKVVGHANNDVDTEILWRYIGTTSTVARFSSRAELQTDIDYRQKVVAAARAWGIPFGETKLNAMFWQTLNEVRDGQTASAALKDLFDQPGKYSLACLRSASYTCLRGASQVSPNFDAIVGREPRTNQDNIIRNTPRSDKASWLPGDWGYIKNTNVANENGLIAGENVIYLGGSFDLTFDDGKGGGFVNTADFWGIIDGEGNNAKNIKKMQTWINTVAFWNPARQSQVQPRRMHLKSPRAACPASSGKATVAYGSGIVVEGGESPFTYSASGLPPGLTLNTTTGVISGTPVAPRVGTAQGYNISITATDSSGAEEGKATSICKITISK